MALAGSLNASRVNLGTDSELDHDPGGFTAYLCRIRIPLLCHAQMACGRRNSLANMSRTSSKVFSVSTTLWGLMLTPGVQWVHLSKYVQFLEESGKRCCRSSISIPGSKPHNEKPSQRAEICTMIHVFGGVWWRRRRLVPAPAVRSPELVRPPIPFPRRLRPLRTSTAPVRPPPEPESWPTPIRSFVHGPEKLPTSPISTNMIRFLLPNTVPAQ